jgi:hypothetical protein
MKFGMVLTSLFLLVAAYLGAYYALVFPGFYCSYIPVRQKPTTCYTHGGQFAENFFLPANWLDRRIRADTWAEQDM